jgi:uncharacterized protein YcaQ
MREQISAAEARRIALAAQGFGARLPETVTARHLDRTLDGLALHQIDSVNVLSRAHYLPAFSRLGGYDHGLFDRAAWGPKRVRKRFEYWAHEASLLPLDLHPLLRWRMAEADRGERGWTNLKRFATERRREAMALLDRIRGEGPLAASDFDGSKGSGGWWGWSDTKATLEWLFWAGHVTTATRRNSFERVYDLPERVIPPAILGLPTPDAATAHRALVERSARAMGVATAVDLRDYFRLGLEETRAAIEALVDEGVLLPVTVKGWDKPAWLHRDARVPRRVKGAALLAPFDPLIWERARAERIFGFRYRIEIYVPAEKRVHGYYVLPLLLDERIVARVDLKADRQGGRLLVQRCHFEPGVPGDAAERLDVELRRMADWLGLGEVVSAG